MPTVQAEFDGQVFVPCKPVDLPRGTKVEVMLPAQPKSAGSMTASEMHEWEEIKRQLEATDPFFPTMDDALRHMRKRP